MLKERIEALLHKEISKPLRSFSINLLLIVGSLFIFFVTIEIGYRIYLHYNKPIAEYTPYGPRYYKNTSGIYRGVRISIDQYGFRNGIDAEAWEKEHRIMLIGDSVGFGSGLDDPFTISNNLNRIMRDSNLGFLNLCNPAYDTIPLLARLHQYGESLGPWKLIIWMYNINDAKHSLRYYPLSSQIVENVKPTKIEEIKNFLIFKWPHAILRRYKNHKKAQEIR